MTAGFDYQNGIFGDCFRTCVANLIGVLPERIPVYRPSYAKDFWSYYHKALGGIAWVQWREPPKGYQLGYVEFSPVHAHCVICYNGKIVWCPSNGNYIPSNYPKPKFYASVEKVYQV